MFYLAPFCYFVIAFLKRLFMGVLKKSAENTFNISFALIITRHLQPFLYGCVQEIFMALLY